MAVFTVHGHEVARLHQPDHELQFFLGCMTAHVYVGDAAEEHVGPLAIEVVDGAVDEELVAGDG